MRARVPGSDGRGSAAQLDELFAAHGGEGGGALNPICSVGDEALKRAENAAEVPGEAATPVTDACVDQAPQDTDVRNTNHRLALRSALKQARVKVNPQKQGK